MSDDEHGSTEDHKEIKIEKFVIHRSWTHSLPQGATWKGADRDSGKTWGACFYSITGWIGLGSPNQGQIGQFK